MKKLMYWSKSYLLPLCLLFALALTSCQESEIIPLDEVDLVGGEIDLPSSFDIKEASDFILDENGEVTGYFDEKLNQRDINGNIVSGQKTTHETTAKNNNSNPLRVIFYTGTNFNSGSAAHYFSSTSTRFKQFPSHRNNALSSVIIAPGCKLVVYDGDYFTGNKRIFAATENGLPFRIKALGAYVYDNTTVSLDNTISSFKIQCSSTEDNFCGYAYKKTSFSGVRFPFFRNESIDFSSKDDFGQPRYPTWDGTISSFATNSYSDCDGFMIYDDHTNQSNPYHWIHPDEDYATLNNLVVEENGQGSRVNESFVTPYDLDNVVTLIIEAPRVVHDFRYANFPIGAILYPDRQFKGRPLILPKNGTEFDNSSIFDKMGFFLAGSYKKIKSVVVAPGCTLRLTNSSAGDPGAGYRNSDYTFISAYADCSNQNTNDFCGVLIDLHLDNDNLDDSPSINERTLPVFKDLSNFTIYRGREFGKKILSLPLILGANNAYSSFRTFPTATNCKGVTFWGNGGNSLPTGKRRWVSVDPSDLRGVNFGVLNNKISGITTEGCNGESTLMGTESYNAGAGMHRFLGDAYNTRTNENIPFWKEFTRLAVRPAVGGFVSLGVSAVLGYFGAENMMTIVGSFAATTVTCAVGMGYALSLSRNADYTGRGLFPATGGYYSSPWQRANLKIAALRGFYFETEAQLSQFHTSPAFGMKKAQWFVPLPTYLVTYNGSTAQINEFINEHGWVKFQKLLKLASTAGTGNPLFGLKSWMDKNMVEQLKYLESDFYLSALETLAAVPAGIYGGYMIGTGIDAGSASVKVNVADIQKRYLRGSFPHATGTNGRIK
jgi:hypothetical protein